MLSPVFCAYMVEDEETGLVPSQIGERKTEELLAIGGVSALSASASEEGIGEASGELFGSSFGAVGESETDAGITSLEVIAGENNGTGA